jgi:hypothetical protein
MRYGARSRGQALFETAIAMPLFLIGLFGVMWAMKDASLSARTQLAVRYGGMVNSLQQPYQAYSLYAMYATIDNVVPATNTACYQGDGTQLTSGYGAFWLPSSSSALVSPCSSAISIVSSPETYTQPVILRNNYSSITATTPVNGYISAAALHGATTTGVRAAENFFRTPDVGTMLTCTTLGSAIKISLEGKTDTAVPSGLTTAMPTVPTPQTVVTGTSAACAPTTTTFVAPAAPY